MDIDMAIRVDAPAALTEAITYEQRQSYEKWEKANKMDLMIIKKPIFESLVRVAPELDNAKIVFACIGESYMTSGLVTLIALLLIVSL
ncbi:UBN2_2 domain-containing protein [Senna tora]|uniref:UBN2_2 domain-containing protein n=1 Tax=Senna tora TaxID=362788 RepID=A0A834WG30_9FABA|nr:UBN2_2 domain-containing protein [Senna tora]